VLIDACCIALSRVNSGVTGRKLAKFLSDVEKEEPKTAVNKLICIAFSNLLPVK